MIELKPTDVLTTRLSQEGGVLGILGTLVPELGKKNINQRMTLNCRLSFGFKAEKFIVIVQELLAYSNQCLQKTTNNQYSWVDLQKVVVL